MNESRQSPSPIDHESLTATIRIETHAERLRQERETFNQIRAQDRRWSALRLAMGWLAALLLPAIAALCAWILLHPQLYSVTTVGTAAATLLADTAALIFSVWKVAIGRGPAMLRPVTQPPSAYEEANPYSSSVEILEARYGTEQHFVDVTSVLQDLLRDGRLESTVSNELAGDPHPSAFKQLIVTYRRGRNTITKTFGEGEKLRLP